MGIERSRRPIGTSRIRRLVRELLEASTLCTIATTDGRALPYVNTAYFAWAPDLRIVWLSEPGSHHSRNVVRDRRAAIAVYDSNQQWGKPDRGIQLFGSAREAAMTRAQDAERLYAERFPDYRAGGLGAYRFYDFRTRRLKVFHEPALGAGTFVTARVDPSGAVAWDGTEIYVSDAGD